MNPKDAIQQVIEEFEKATGDKFIDSGDMREYRVLTVFQPWASLLVYGIKRFETRPGPTSWTAEKGSYLIHAASKWTQEQAKLCNSDPFFKHLFHIADEIGMEYHPKTGKTDFICKLPLGKIIGSVEVEECDKIIYASEFAQTNKNRIINNPELSFGDYSSGRYAWICQNPRLLKNPIPYKGGQGYYQRYKGNKSLIEFI